MTHDPALKMVLRVYITFKSKNLKTKEWMQGDLGWDKWLIRVLTDMGMEMSMVRANHFSN